MNSLKGSSPSNLKKVLRTALVGITPGDQVMLKGYLRVLLRLEADLEWVGANHPQVDLFMISDEFRNAASVKKLLSTQLDKPVLYIARTDNGDGRIVGDILILPLSSVTELSAWLTNNLGVLTTSVTEADGEAESVSRSAVQPVNKPTAHTISSTSAQQPDISQAAKSVETSPTASYSLDASTTTPTSQSSASAPTAAPAKRHVEPLSELKNSDSPRRTASNTQSHPIDTAQYEGVIDLIKLLQRKPTGYYELITKDGSSAVIEPRSGRLWQTKNQAAPIFSLKWQLTPYQGAPLEDTQAQDLLQWLWLRAWTQPNDLLPLISNQQRYRLRYWIKPKDSDDRRELLRILTALENAPLTVTELAISTEISEKTAKKALAGLLLSGCLQADSYESLTIKSLAADLEAAPANAQASSLPNQPIGNRSEASISNNAPTSPSAPAKALSPLESVLARRESGESAAPSSSSYDSNATGQATHGTAQTTASASDDAKQEKRGFLSKLRAKLGL